MHTAINHNGREWSVVEMPGGQPVCFPTEQQALQFAFDRSDTSDLPVNYWQAHKPANSLHPAQRKGDDNLPVSVQSQAPR